MVSLQEELGQAQLLLGKNGRSEKILEDQS
jgi:hypothetical protein